MLWVKAFHIISVVCWFAALFYLPRLFVYHRQAIAANDQTGSDRFKIMERKLYRGIMMPAGILTTFFGLWLIGYNASYYFHQPWMIAKLMLVVVLWGFHFYCGHLVKSFRGDKSTRSEKFFRIINEIPTVILVAVVILIVVK